MNEFSKVIITNPYIIRLITQGLSNSTLMNAVTLLSILEPNMANAPLATALWRTIFAEARKADILATPEEQAAIVETIQVFGMKDILSWMPKEPQT